MRLHFFVNDSSYGGACVATLILFNFGSSLDPLVQQPDVGVRRTGSDPDGNCAVEIKKT